MTKENRQMIIKTASRLLLFTTLLWGLSLNSAGSQATSKGFLDIETGWVFPGYCDVQIPGDRGTRFSLTNDLSTSGSLFIRLRAGYRFNPRHSVFVLFAPLSLDGSGSVDQPVDFNGVTFPAMTPLESIYRFNSYRITYRYGIKESGKLRIGIGLTAKIRDAAIRLRGGGLESEKTNVGLVPLFHFLLDWRLTSDWRFLLEGDAAAASQGRAEDVFIGLVYEVSEKLSLRAGYRILEGGADVEEVYNFALLNYAAVGASYHF
jgi:hypothetical protein